MKQDEILVELVESLRAHNTDLRKQLEERPTPWFGFSIMWSDFWKTIGGIWANFWTAIASMWNSIWQNEDATVGVSIILVIGIVASSIVGYHAVTISQPQGTIPILTGQYELTVNTTNSCYFVYERLSNGDKAFMSACIKDRSEALKALQETRAMNGKTR